MEADVTERLSLSERLTRQFYDWEVRGRGWWRWDGPVELEPPFRPFVRTFPFASSSAGADTGVRPTFLSALADRAVEFFSKKAISEVHVLPAEPDEERPRYFRERDSICELQFALPAQTKITKVVAEQLLGSLGNTSRPLSF